MLSLSTYSTLDARLKKIFDEISFRAVNGRIEPFVVDERNNRIGILTSSPRYPLDINGNTNITGSLMVDTVNALKDIKTQFLGVTKDAIIGGNLACGTLIATRIPKLVVGFSNDNYGPTGPNTGTEGAVLYISANNTDTISAGWFITPGAANQLRKQGNMIFNADPANVHTSTIIRFDVDNTTRLTLDSSGNFIMPSTGGYVQIPDGTTTTDGALKFDRTNEDLSIGDGSASQIVHMGAWKTWTPTVTQSTTPTFTTTRALYTQVGKTVIAHCTLQFDGGTSGTAGNVILLGGLPVNMKNADGNGNKGVYNLLDSGTAFYGGSAVSATTSSVKFIDSGQADYIGAAPSFGLTTNDILSATLTYEAA